VTRVFVVLMLLPLACAQQPAAPPAQPAPVQAPTGPRVILPDGFAVSVEIANTDELRAQGLMFRDEVKPGAGMIFFFAEDDVYPFWMKNTLIPLDMIWIDASRRVAHVKADVQPCKVEDCPSYSPGVPARYVLELAAGEAAKHGLAPGRQLRFEGMDHVTVR
jgi:uncharacterized membrane protein (UPF0127 family)